MSLIDSLAGGAKNLFIATRDSASHYQYVKKHRFVTCQYFKGNKIYEFKGVISPDQQWITPAPINQDFHIMSEIPGIKKKGVEYKPVKWETSFTREPYGDTVYVLSYNCPHTIDPTKWDIVIDHVRQGGILSAIAYMIFRTSILRYMLSPDKRAMIMMVIISLLFGVILGVGFGGLLVGG